MRTQTTMGRRSHQCDASVRQHSTDYLRRILVAWSCNHVTVTGQQFCVGSAEQSSNYKQYSTKSIAVRT